MSSSSTFSSELRALLLRIALLMSPLLLLVATYVVLDPFKVLRHHTRFYGDGSPVALNRDYVSTQSWLQSVEHERWDSYIFGSSRSLAFLTRDWAEYLPAGAKPYHFDASDESLYGVARKVALIDARGMKLDHVLLVVDANLLAAASDNAFYMQIKHPALTGQSAVSFQAHYLSAYFFDFFALKFLHFKLTGKLKPYMTDVLDKRVMGHTWPGNDRLFTSAEAEIERAGADAYVERRAAAFRRRAAGVSRAVVGPAQSELLREIGLVLRRRGTSLRVIVSPRFDQRPLHSDDLIALREHFGASNVHDFSSDREITTDPRNFYDPAHYKVSVAQGLLRRVYGAPD